METNSEGWGGGADSRSSRHLGKVRSTGLLVPMILGHGAARQERDTRKKCHISTHGRQYYREQVFTLHSKERFSHPCLGVIRSLPWANEIGLK